MTFGVNQQVTGYKETHLSKKSSGRFEPVVHHISCTFHIDLLSESAKATPPPKQIREILTFFHAQPLSIILYINYMYNLKFILEHFLKIVLPYLVFASFLNFVILLETNIEDQLNSTNVYLFTMRFVKIPFCK